jgi:hypothetical protein
MNTELTIEHIKNICKIGQQENTCAFIMGFGGVFSCAKGSGLEKTIRSRLDAGLMSARGDHCSGPPLYERVVE